MKNEALTAIEVFAWLRTRNADFVAECFDERHSIGLEARLAARRILGGPKHHRGDRSATNGLLSKCRQGVIRVKGRQGGMQRLSKVALLNLSTRLTFAF
jgi:hypothetical protein